jgi:hypothetical protein
MNGKYLKNPILAIPMEKTACFDYAFKFELSKNKKAWATMICDPC